MKKILLALIFIAPPGLKPYLLKWFCGAKLGTSVHVGWFSAIMGRTIEIDAYSEIRAFTLLVCDGDVKIGAYSVLSNMTLIYGSASFSIGDHCYIGPQCLINVEEDVSLGNVSALGPRCVIFTHGSFLPFTEGYWTKIGGVEIGSHVWIAAEVFLHPGVHVGDDVFVNSRSVIAQDVPNGVAVEGFPARQMADMRRLKRNMTPQRLNAAVSNMLQRFGDIVLERKLCLRVERDGEHALRFDYDRRRYLVVTVSSQGYTLPTSSNGVRGRLIALVNNPTWEPPMGREDALIFDLQMMRTCRSDDKVHAELWRFLRMYYGVIFEFNDATRQDCTNISLPERANASNRPAESGAKE